MKEFTNKRNIIHRDLKPENIMMSKNLSKVYIADFGLSKPFSFLNHNLTLEVQVVY
jgi:serine/threonine protein kinase